MTCCSFTGEIALNGFKTRTDHALDALVQDASEGVDDIIHLIVRMEKLTLDAQVQGEAEDRHGVDVEGDQKTQHVGGTHDTNGPDVEGSLIQEMVVVEWGLPDHLFTAFKLPKSPRNTGWSIEIPLLTLLGYEIIPKKHRGV